MYQKMIQIAEKELNIPITKKFGAKPLRKDYPLVSREKLCLLFGKTRQSWYKLTQAKESQMMKELLLIEKVMRIRKELPRLGTEKLYLCLKPFLRSHQIKIGRDKLNDILRKHGLLVPKSKRRAKTTYSKYGLRKYQNLIQKIELIRANQLWVSDITYIPIGSHFGYLSLVTDAYSHKNCRVAFSKP